MYKVATTNGLHAKNYLISSESYPFSDVSWMLNNQEPKNKSRIIYGNQLAKKDLDIKFKCAIEPLKTYNS